MRQSGDVDLLVRRSDVGRAVDVLVRSGFHPLFDDKADAKAVTLHGRRGVEIDLHVRLARDHRWVQPLWDLEPVLFGSSPGRLALPAEARLVHAAGHLWWTPIGMRQLSGLIDLFMLSRRSNLDKALSLASSLDLAEACWFGMSVMSRLGWGNTPSWPRPGRLERFAYGSSRRRPNAERLLTLMRAPDRETVLEILQESVRRRRSDSQAH